MKSLRLFDEVNFAIIANRMGNFVYFGSFLALAYFTFQLILGYRLQRICSLGLTLTSN